MNTRLLNHFIELPIETPDGCFVAGYSQLGLAALNFPRRPGGLSSGGKPSTIVPQRIQALHQLTVRALERVLAGNVPGELPPLDLSWGTHFQQRVWRELGNIPMGRMKTYGQIAQAIGRPNAVRAVGGACGANPIPVLIPCHRVVAANHQPGGFSGGLDWKKKLLEREGIQLEGW